MLHRLVFWILFLGGSIALGLAGYSYFSDDPGNRLVAQENNIEIADCPPGDSLRVAVRLRNDSRRFVRIVGVEEC